MTDFVDTKPTGLYEAAIGEKNQDYYLDKFEDFDQQGPSLHTSWSWAAFLGGGAWALYRKMYGWFFGWWVVATAVTIFSKVPDAQIQQVLTALVLVSWVGFSVFANALYHRKIKARIATAQKLNSDASRVSRRLSASGGVHTWVPIVFGGIPIIGIVAAVALPAFQDYTKRTQSVAGVAAANAANKPAAQVDWNKGVITPPNQFATGGESLQQRSQIDEFLSNAPTNQLTELPTQQNAARMPIKYGKDDTPLDGQPATQQNAEKANPFDQFDPITAHPVNDAKNRPFTYEEASAPQAKSAVEQEHYRRIYVAHPDADAIHVNPGFQAWVAKYPAYQRILSKGSTQEIIDMFTAYKNQL